MIRVAMDGPAGVGKSSTAKALAKYFDFTARPHGGACIRASILTPHRWTSSW